MNFRNSFSDSQRVRRNGKTGGLRRPRMAKLLAESLESRTVMDASGLALMADPYLELPGLDPSAKLPVQISQPVAGTTDVIVAVESQNGLSQLQTWSGQGGKGHNLVDFTRSELLFSNQGVSYVKLALAGQADAQAVIDTLATETFVVWSAPDMVYRTDTGFDPRDFVPNDPRYSSQWHHPLMGNTQAWDVAPTFGSGISVAILDDGVTIAHEDLAQNIWVNPGEIPGNGIDDDKNGYTDDVNGWDFSSGDNNPNPVGLPSHGTPVAGNVAARVNNGVGLAGVAGMATLMPVRFYGSGAWTSSVIAQSYAYAVNNGAKILNVSYNIDGFANDPLFRAALSYVYDAGALYMNSAGNNGQLNPARGVYDQGLFVMASDPADKLLSYSNYGKDMDVIAPADPVWTTSDTGYETFNGTSSATPVASGAMALVWGAHPTWTRDQVVAAVLGTAKNVSSANPGYNSGFLGYGRIDTNSALTQTLRAPKLGNIVGLPAEGGITNKPVSSFVVDTASIYDASTVANSNFEMLYAGPDRTFGTSDDRVLPVTVNSTNGGNYYYGTNHLQMNVMASMPAGLYRFSALSGPTGIRDPFGQQLDGNGDGTAGDNLVRNFEIAYQAGGVAYLDDNRSGVQESAEPGLGNLLVFADNNANGIFDTVPNTATSTDLPKSIADYTTSTSNLVVSTIPGTVYSLKVQLSLTHTYDSDLTISLVSPSGQRIVLASGNGGSGQNYTNTVFDDTATTSISSGSAPFTGSYRPIQPLSSLYGESVNGTWKLQIYDNYGGDTGSLTAWNIQFVSSTETNTRTDTNGNWAMNGLPLNAAMNIIVENPNPAQLALSQPVGGSYPVNFPTTSTTISGLDYVFLARPNFSTSIGGVTIPAGGTTSFIAQPNSDSQVKAINIKNNGLGTLWIDSITTTAPFEILSTVPTSIPVGQSASIDVIYHAPSGGIVQQPLLIKVMDIDPVVPVTSTITLNGLTITPSISGSVIGDMNGNNVLDTGETAYPGFQLFADMNNNGVRDAGTPVNKAAAGLPLAIPDASTTAKTLAVSGITGYVGNITVNVQASHSWAGDLKFVLVNPSGFSVLLYADPTDPSGTNFNVTFDDNATATINTGTVPTGVVQPQESLQNLLLSDPNGTWTLYATDQVMYDSGSLTGFSINFLVGSEPQQSTQADGSYTFYNLPAGSVSVRPVTTPTGMTYATPITGTYTTTLVAGQMISNVLFVPMPIKSISGQVTDYDTGTGLAKTRIYNDLNDNGQFDYTPVVKNSAGVKVAIRDLKTATKTLTVSGSTLPIQGVSVSLDVQHRYLSDLTVTLISPSGIRVKLMDRDGGSGQNLKNAVFSDFADVKIAPGLKNYNGSYTPRESLTAFDTASANGTWSIEITDNAIGDVGWFNRFSLNFITTQEFTTLSNSLGYYTIAQAPAATYNLKAIPFTTGWNLVTPGSGSLTPTLNTGSALIGQNFEFQQASSNRVGSSAKFTSKSFGSDSESFYLPPDLLLEISQAGSGKKKKTV